MKGRLWFKEYFPGSLILSKQCLTLIVVYLEMVLFSFLGYIGNDDMASEPEQSWRALIGYWWCHPYATDAQEKHQGLTVFLTFFSFFHSSFFLLIHPPPFSFLQIWNPTFTLTVLLEFHILATLSLKVAGDRCTQPDTALAWCTLSAFTERILCCIALNIAAP